MPKKILSFFLIIYLLIPSSAVAQEIATESAELSSATPSAELSSELLPLILDDPDPPTTQIKSDTIIRKLNRSSYSSKDKISLVISSGKARDTRVKIYNPDGQEVTALIETIHEENPAVITLTMPSQFKSGRYHTVITASDGTQSTQDFLWGVLAINPDQSVYLPNSNANFSIAVLDETGLMVCNAIVTLQIKTPNGNTDSIPVQVSPNCSIKDYFLTPDYFATYKLSSEGTYKLTLTAKTDNGEYSISDSIEVKSNPDFLIKRTSATRIFPPKEYPMLIEITANSTFSGQIIESVPSIFAISPGSNPYNSIEIATISAQPRVLNLPNLRLPFDNVFPISQNFGSYPDDQLLSQKYEAYGVVGHDGTDFATPMGTPIVAIDDGTVVMADSNGPYGQTVILEHTWGKSYYGHLSQITTTIGSKRPKGHPVGLSGNSGLSTGPHLHLSIKPNNSDPDNGYFGKINPLPYLENTFSEGDLTYTTGQPSLGTTRLIWNVSLSPGDKISMDYKYKVPNISPQFYLTGPIQIGSYQEPRQWQLAIDADGSGTNTISPNIGEISTLDNTYVFSYDPSATMDSGGITITIPTGWSAPQGLVGTAGYTTASVTGTSTIGTVLDNSDVEDPTGGIWQENDGDMCGATTLNTATDIVVDTTNKQEGSGSIQCVNSASDASDSWGYIFDSDQNWSTFCNGGACSEISFWIRPVSAGTANRTEFAWSSTTDVQGGRIAACSLSGLANNTWTYFKCALSGTLTTVRSFGFICLHATCDPFDGGAANVDDVMIGPGSPSFSGQIATVRFIDLAATDTLSITYGSGGGTSGTDHPATSGTHTFTTKSKELVTGTYTDISNHPWVTLVESNANLLRHGRWFNSTNLIQPFAF